MTADQIRKAQPTAEPDPDTDTLYGGARCALSIRSLEVASSKFRVCFYMLDGKLKQVTLKALDPHKVMFESMVDLLRGKYGAEIGASEPLCKPGLLNICRAEWVLPTGVNISALYMAVGSNEPLVNINYQTRMAADASKL